MTFDEAIDKLSREESFKATVYAMNTLLIRKGFYSAEEFEELFCEHAENSLRGFKRKTVEASRPSSEAVQAIP